MDDETRKYYEELPEPSGAETVLMLGCIAGAIFVMKKISEATGHKETWKQWLTRNLG